MLFYQHRSLQSAADAAAYNAAITYSYNTNHTSAAITTQAQATVASYGFTVTTAPNQVNQAYVTATATTFATLPAVQVTISRPQTAIFSSIFFSVLPNSVSATAVYQRRLSRRRQGTACSRSAIIRHTGTTSNAPDAIHAAGKCDHKRGRRAV